MVCFYLLWSITFQINLLKVMSNCVRFTDLFAGIGGTRKGLEDACQIIGVSTKCVFTSEVKEQAITVYQENFVDNNIYGDIAQTSLAKIPEFDIL